VFPLGAARNLELSAGHDRNLHIYYDNGQKEYCVLFVPWGHYKRGDNYMIADFSAIKKEFKRGTEKYGNFLMK
jgi:hypothetical protein